MRLFERLTIAGVGLVGGSLGAAVREAGLAGEVIGFGRSEANLGLARERGLIDRVVRDPGEAVAEADVIVLAAPVATCVQLAEAFRSRVRPGTLLTDVGSVKAELVAALEARWAGVGPVVGAHPIAGSEASGAGAAQADLFRGRRCILTPTRATDICASSARRPVVSSASLATCWTSRGSKVAGPRCGSPPWTSRRCSRALPNATIASSGRAESR